MHFLSFLVGVALCVIAGGLMITPPAWTTTTKMEKFGGYFAVFVIVMLWVGIVTTGLSLALLLI